MIVPGTKSRTAARVIRSMAVVLGVPKKAVMATAPVTSPATCRALPNR
jgi:hypothetical protein